MGSGPEFRLLGPLEVWVGQRATPVRAGKHRVLLASLLLRANRTVGVDELVERLWEGAPPARTRGTLQTYVMRLRQALGDPAIIRTVADGYQIQVPTERVDVFLFADLAARAERARAAGNLVEAAAAYTEALDLWRGPALADVPSELLHREEVPRLTEQRLRVLEARIDVELVMGRHAFLVSELRALTGEYPLRERFWGQLMLALYRSSRQAEALDAFRQVNRLLDEQLGTAPSAELRALHQSILLGDPELAGPPPVEPVTVSQPAADVPTQLPADLTDFVGRADLVERISELVAPREPSTAVPIVTLSGPPGVGKTSLAVHVAHLLRDRFPDGQLYVDLRGYAPGPAPSTVDVLARFLRALGVAAEQIPLDADEQSTMFRSLLSGRRLLLVLDNAAAPDQVRPLLPGDPSCPVLVTSRDDLRGLTAMNGARRVALTALAADESVALLAGVLNGHGSALAPGDLAELAELCAHLPLALRIAAAHLAAAHNSGAGDSLAHYRTALRADGRLGGVTATFAQAYAALPAAPRRMFLLLSLVPGPDFTAYAAANLTELPLAETERHLDRLVAASLIREVEPGRFQFHDLLRSFATERLAAESSAEDREAARVRLLDFYLHTVERCAEVLYPDMQRLPPARRATPVRLPTITGHQQALHWLDTERANLTAAIQHTAHSGPAAAAWRLADAMRGYLWLGKHVTEWLTTARLGLHAAHAKGHQLAEAAMHQNLGTLHWTLGDYQTSLEHYNHSLRLYRVLDNTDAEAGIHNNLGIVYLELGNLAEAKKHFTRCLDAKRASGHPDGGEATVLLNLGLLAAHTGELTEALDLLDQALRTSAAHGFRASQAGSHNSIGMTLRLRGELDKALEHHTLALRISQELGYRETTAQVLEGIAWVYLEQGRYTEAIEHARKAAAELSDGGDQQVTTQVLLVLAEAQLRLGDHRRADEQYRQALTTARKIHFRLAEAWTLLGLARTRLASGRPAEVPELCRQVLAITQSAGMRITEGSAHGELAAAHLDLGSPSQAVDAATTALAIHRQTGHRPGEARALHVLGLALDALGRRADALAAWRDALALFEQTGLPEATTLRELLFDA